MQVVISIKVVEPKPFTGAITQVRAWFSALKLFFIAVQIPYMVMIQHKYVNIMVL